MSITFLLLLLSYNLESGVWNTVPINSGLVPRYGHSLAAYQVSTALPRRNLASCIIFLKNAVEQKKPHVSAG